MFGLYYKKGWKRFLIEDKFYVNGKNEVIGI